MEKNKITTHNSYKFIKDNTLKDLNQSYFNNIINTNTSDPYIIGHSDRVSEYSVLIGKKMGLDNDTIDSLRIGGLFHDIGKIGIPDDILLKDSKLNENEYSQIKKHTSIGANLFKENSNLKSIIPIIEYHHEKYDGTGYPSNLKGSDIPLIARITAVADTFDAITSKRSYKGAFSVNDAISEIKKCSGSQLDPEVANVFLDILENNYSDIKNIQEKYKIV